MEDTMPARLDHGISATTDPATPDPMGPDASPDAVTPVLEEPAAHAPEVVVEEILGQLHLPELPSFEDVGPVDARALSKTLFERLESIEEGTHEYSYVRNTLVELNVALVKFAASRFRSRSEPSAPAASPSRTSSRSAPSA
ncbi:hypothetical protein N566_28360 [Streptomycetaceae bacterium MP113-05]|nr:hypothetical protein N566_28360 [Streptomycetaceae bacterium MP113-05]